MSQIIEPDSNGFFQTYWLTLLAASLVYAFSAFFTGQGVVANLIAAISCFVFLILAVVAGVKKNKAGLMKRFVQILIFILMVLGTKETNGFNNDLAEKRAAIVVKACQDYQKKNGAYPKALSDLVPKFLPNIPRPKIQFNSVNQFGYLPETHEVYWVLIPVFLRKFVNVETGSTRILD